MTHNKNPNGGRPQNRGGNRQPNRQQPEGGNRQAAKPRAAARASRGQAIRAGRMNSDTVNKAINAIVTDVDRVQVTARPLADDLVPKLRVIGLGGMNGGGAKNMMVVEYQNDAIVIDCGNELGVNLPGVNFAINDITYLRKIKDKIKAYVITHGHLDHIGGLPYVLPEIPAPVYGSRFTIAMIEQTMANTDHKVEGFNLQTVIMNQDSHEQLKIGRDLSVELVRVTHSIPGSTAVVLRTPVGMFINTGDFRLDPEPLDRMPTDIKRLEELGKEGVLCLMSDSTTGEKLGRTETEQTLEPSFHQIFRSAPGRVFVGVFSTNINRIQMLVNAAVEDGRKIAIDGRSMMLTLETAVKHGFVKIPKGTFVPMANIGALPDQEIVVIATGSQGEPNAALVRMSEGAHKHIKLKSQDTVILSSTPIPESGNDAAIGRMVDGLVRMGVHVFRHATHELDRCGPLHVSGHAGQDEHRDLVNILKPKFYLPIYGAVRSKQYLIEMAVEEGIPRKNTYNNSNGEVIEFTSESMTPAGVVEHGTVLVDNTGAIVSNVVVKDRMLMAEDGIVSVMLTIDKKTGGLLSSPDIITRGFIYMRDNEDLMNDFRNELKRVVAQRYKRVDIDRFKQELKDHVTFFLYERTQRSPIVIPVVNVVGGRGELRDQAIRRTEMNGQDQAD
jgi:ribonuclease J